MELKNKRQVTKEEFEENTDSKIGNYLHNTTNEYDENGKLIKESEIKYYLYDLSGEEVKINAKKDLEYEKIEIQLWFEDNDWITNKIIVGEWDKNKPEFIEYKKERRLKRLRLDEIKKMLK